MTLATVINSTGFTVLSPINKAVKTISLAYNKHVEFLPENLFENFPDLQIVDSAACSLRELSKATFRNLFKLEQINLDGNKIERIEGDTFETLTLLREIFIS
jgi:Leucine-rich repeat (LRR) protein